MKTTAGGQVAAVAAVALLTLRCSTAARLLAVFPYNGHSHFTMVEPLLWALAGRGHDVTVISPFPRRNGSVHGTGRYTDVDVSDALPPAISQMDVTENREPWQNPVTGLRGLCRMNHRVCVATFEHPRVRALFRRRGRGTFDAVLTEAFSTDCFAVLAHVFDAPLVSVRTCDYSPQLNGRVANPQNPAYLVYHLFTYVGHKMTFVQRLINALAVHFGAVGYHMFSDGPSTELARRHFGPETPPVPDIVRRRTALVFVNGHHSLTQSRPLVPNVIEVGGLHIVDQKNVTNKWSSYCDSCDQGVVYVSFGSLLKGTSFPDQFLTSMVRAFETLPYCVLWKYEGDDMQSKRIKVSKWMPQQQILSHKNVKAFITHGGLMGVMEAVYFGVPMIGMPVFGDQQSNIANCVEKGVAIGLDYRRVTEQKLVESIRAIVTDGRYRAMITELSAKFKDRPMNALDTALFWTEYVLKHGNGTNIVSPAIDLDFHQYFLLDVVGVVFLTLLVLFYSVFQIKKLLR